MILSLSYFHNPDDWQNLSLLHWGCSPKLHAMNCRIGSSAKKKSGESRGSDPGHNDDLQNHRSLYQHVWKAGKWREGSRQLSLDGGCMLCLFLHDKKNFSFLNNPHSLLIFHANVLIPLYSLHSRVRENCFAVRYIECEMRIRWLWRKLQPRCPSILIWLNCREVPLRKCLLSSRFWRLRARPPNLSTSTKYSTKLSSAMRNSTTILPSWRNPSSLLDTARNGTDSLS